MTTINSPRSPRRFAPLRGVAVAVCLAAGLATLAGCGGDSAAQNSFGATKAADPAAIGLEPATAIGAAANTDFRELSGLGTPDGTTAYVTAATASTASVLTAFASGTTIPLGFAPGGHFLDDKYYGAVAPGASVVFRAALVNGQSSSGTVTAIDPSKVVLTTPEVAGFSLPLTFTRSNNGPLANASYTTAPFTVPFTTSGLHTFVLTVGDTSGKITTTTYTVVVLKPTDSVVIAQLVDAKGNGLAGATATITNPMGGVTGQGTSDAQGVVILFTSPGAQTITAKSGTLTTTSNVTLTAGQTLGTTLDSSNASVPLTITLQ